MANELARYVKSRSSDQHVNPHYLDANETNAYFAMNCNGYYLHRSGEWEYMSDVFKPFMQVFDAQRTSFFGPSRLLDRFYPGREGFEGKMEVALHQEPVIDLIRRLKQNDEDQAARIAYLLGGVVRQFATRNQETISDLVSFVSRMGLVADTKSVEAVVSCMAMYVISGGSVEDDKPFEGQVYNMAEAISDDPIIPAQTSELGLSQVARLRAFTDKLHSSGYRPFPFIGDWEEDLKRFPTVGAEFHFKKDAPSKHPHFWKRLALLNMSQYQKGCHIQLSREDQNVIEVRMNPSLYPITVANWKRMMGILPELKQTYFTLTLNRTNASGDFNWRSQEDAATLHKLRALGLLCYAGLTERMPKITDRGEIEFGTVYLGQTVRKTHASYEFTGDWGHAPFVANEGSHGQLGIYAGLGDILPYLAYYCSMALHAPNVLRGTNKKELMALRTLRQALDIRPDDIEYIFNTIKGNIKDSPELDRATNSGNQIIGALMS